MRSAIQGHFDGTVVVFDEPVPISNPSEVLVLFGNGRRLSPEEARSTRKRLRGSGKGLNLVEKLLIERRQDD